MSDKQFQPDILERLTQAISTLEYAVTSAKETIQSKPKYPPEAIERLDTYLILIEQQKQALPRIAAHIERGDNDSVASESSRVNAMSSFIREDASELITMLANPESAIKVNRGLVN